MLAEELKAISIALAVFSPLSWAVTILFDGLRQHRARIYLLLVLLSASFTFLMSFTNFFGFHKILATFFPIRAAVALSIFPLFYLYVKSLTTEKQVNITRFKKIYFHFLFPFIVMMFYLVVQKFLMNENEELLFIKYIIGQTDQIISPLFYIGRKFYSVSIILFMILSILYLFFTYKSWHYYHKNIIHLFPDNSGVELKWVRILYVLLIILMVFFIAINIISNRQLAENTFLISASYLSFALFFWFLGLQGFKQQELFVPEYSSVENTYLKPTITKELFESFIIKHKPHRRIHVSAYDFCLFFQLSPTEFTKFLKNEYGKTFRNIINTHRVQDAAELMDTSLLNKQIPEVDEIARTTGFDSLNTFQKVFKKHFHLSINEYIEKKLNTLT